MQKDAPISRAVELAGHILCRAGVSAAQTYSAEAAATVGSLYLQGEYFWFNVERKALVGLPDLKCCKVLPAKQMQ